MEVRYLCGGVDEWQRRRIQHLEENTVAYADMAWKVDGEILPDCKQMYAASSFMTTLFDTSMSRGFTEENGLKVFPLDEKKHILDMVRVFCHTGLITFSRGETVLMTIERYAAFHFYGIDEGKNVLKKLILDNLTPSNSITAFEYAVHRDDDSLLCDIKRYISDYAFLVFRHRNFFIMGRESMEDLVKLCRSDSLNVPEVDLLSNLFRLCERKIGDKEYMEFVSAFDILTHKFGEHSLWDSVRLTSITMEEFMAFVQKHPGAMKNDSIVQVMQTIYSPTTSGKKRRRFQTVSSYPRNLDFRAAENPQVDITYWERDKVQAFFVFDFGKKETVALPSIAYGNRHVRCIVNRCDKSLGLSGRIVRPHEFDSRDEEVVHVTASIVNFRHDRWKKTSVSVKLTNTCEFSIPNILSCNAIEGSPGVSTGYEFDVNKYPDYIEGEWLMMCLSLDGSG